MGTVAGTFKWYDEKKGYGFIKREDGGKDVFVHARQLDASRFPGYPEKVPEAGLRVMFDVELNPKRENREYAINISPL